MSRLNYHHLYYFWQVATNGNLTQVAHKLHVSQSALSNQIRQLEDSMGSPLFERRGRKLLLTERGQRVLAYAQDIFSKGEELESLIRRGIAPEYQHLRIGVFQQRHQRGQHLGLFEAFERFGGLEPDLGRVVAQRFDQQRRHVVLLVGVGQVDHRDAAHFGVGMAQAIVDGEQGGDGHVSAPGRGC